MHGVARPRYPGRVVREGRQRAGGGRAGRHAASGLAAAGAHRRHQVEGPGVTAAGPELLALAEREGAWVEDKQLALVVHTRRSPDPDGALVRLTGPVTALAEVHGLEVHPGRYVLELRPPGFDKAGALRSLCEPAPSAVLFAGDDVGDLSAFDAVQDLRRRGVPGLLVCSGSDEGPAVLRERADVVVDGPAGVVALLASLLD